MEQCGTDEIPRRWAWATINQLVGPNGVFKDGDWVESKDQDPNGSVRLIQLADIGDGDFRDKSARFLTREKASELNCTFLAQGDLLVARMPDPLGRACLFPLSGVEKFVTVVDVCVVRLNQAHIDSKYFMYALNSPQSRKKISGHQTGSTRKRISRGNLSTVPFPIAPLHEQRRIVAKIEELFSELDKGIESLKTAQAQLKVYRQALLKHAFEGKLTAQWRADNPDKLETADALLKRIQKEREQRYQQQVAEWEAGGKQGSKPKAPKPLPPLTTSDLKKLPELPKGWIWTKFGELVQNSQNGISKRNGEAGKEFIVLRLADIFEQSISLNSPRTIRLTEDETQNYALRKDELLCIRVNGSPDLVGRMILVSDDVGAAFCDHFIRFRLLTSVCSATYLRHFFDTHGVRRYVELNKVSSAGQNTVNQETLNSALVSVCGLEEQKLIVQLLDEKFSEVDQLEQTLTSSLNQADALRQSILKKAFSGQLVPQDPADEPAVELLARIKAEQSAIPKAKKARK